MNQSMVNFAIICTVLVTFNIHSAQAANITKCWSGWATGKDLMKTMRNTTEMNCPTNTKFCMKWHLMTSKFKFKHFED